MANVTTLLTQVYPKAMSTAKKLPKGEARRLLFYAWHLQQLVYNVTHTDSMELKDYYLDELDEVRKVIEELCA